MLQIGTHHLDGGLSRAAAEFRMPPPEVEHGFQQHLEGEASDTYALAVRDLLGVVPTLWRDNASNYTVFNSHKACFLGWSSGLLGAAANLSLTKWCREIRHPVIASILELRVSRIAASLGLFQRTFYRIERRHVFDGLSIRALVDIDVVQKAFADTALLVRDSIAFVHLFAKGWDMFHSMVLKGRSLAVILP
jgi:hypothetical protein